MPTEVVVTALFSQNSNNNIRAMKLETVLVKLTFNLFNHKQTWIIKWNQLIITDVMHHLPMRWGFFCCLSNHTWHHWYSPSGPGTWAEVGAAPRPLQGELSGCPILTPLPLCRRSAGTCLNYISTHTHKEKHQGTETGQQKNWMNYSQIHKLYYVDLRVLSILSHSLSSTHITEFLLTKGNLQV